MDEQTDKKRLNNLPKVTQIKGCSQSQDSRQVSQEPAFATRKLHGLLLTDTNKAPHSHPVTGTGADCKSWRSTVLRWRLGTVDLSDTFNALGLWGSSVGFWICGTTDMLGLWHVKSVRKVKKETKNLKSSFGYVRTEATRRSYLRRYKAKNEDGRCKGPNHKARTACFGRLEREAGGRGHSLKLQMTGHEPSKLSDWEVSRASAAASASSEFILFIL